MCADPHMFLAVMSANEHSDTVFECIRAGAEDYLLKPLTKKEVQYIWQHVWRRKHQPAVKTAPQQAKQAVGPHLWSLQVAIQITSVLQP